MPVIYSRLTDSNGKRQYILLVDDTFATRRAVPRKYTNPEITIEPTSGGWVLLTAHQGAAWDGATAAPDFVSVIRGTLYHDLIYRNIPQIAATWGWRQWRVRRWGDKVFDEVNKAEGAPWLIKRIYYRAVRSFGWLARLVGRWRE